MKKNDSPRGSLHEVAARLAALLPEPNALVGGLAVAAHGYVRATDDIDFVSSADPKEIRARLAKAGIETSSRRGDVLAGDLSSVVYGRADGIRFDVLSPPVSIDWSRTVLLPLTEGSRLRVVDLETLVHLKMRAGGPQDLVDLVQLVRLHPEMETRALALAEAYGVRGRFEEWLSDPRVRSPEPLARARRGDRPAPRRHGGRRKGK